jgi:sirohydrochlorin ferrochelatase
MLLPLSTAIASEHWGILVVVHGAPMEEWNRSVRALEEPLSAHAREAGFTESRLVFMEFTKPTIAEGMREMEGKVDRVIVVPLFIAPSAHTEDDLPALLGMKASPDILSTLAAEGAKVYTGSLKATVITPLSDGELLDHVIADRVSSLSVNPGNESVVFLAHGDRLYARVWDDLLQRIAGRVSAQTGIPRFEAAYVHMGQLFTAEGLPAIHRAAEGGRRVILQPVYLSTSAKDLTWTLDERNPLTGTGYFDELDVVWGNPLLQDDRVVPWIVSHARSAVEAIEETEE